MEKEAYIFWILSLFTRRKICPFPRCQSSFWKIIKKIHKEPLKTWKNNNKYHNFYLHAVKFYNKPLSISSPAYCVNVQLSILSYNFEQTPSARKVRMRRWQTYQTSTQFFLIKGKSWFQIQKRQPFFKWHLLKLM